MLAPVSVALRILQIACIIIVEFNCYLWSVLLASFLRMRQCFRRGSMNSAFTRILSCGMLTGIL